jgi:hypothetical protein
MNDTVDRIARSLHAEMLTMEREIGNGGCEWDELADSQRTSLERLARAIEAEVISPLMRREERLRSVLTQDELGNPDDLEARTLGEYDKGWRDAMQVTRAALQTEDVRGEG